MSKKTATNETPEIETSEAPAAPPKATPAPQVPALGRHVLFHYRENQDRTAIIVGVKDATTVDLHVHMRMAEDKREPVVELLGVTEGTELNCWSWPPRS